MLTNTTAGPGGIVSGATTVAVPATSNRADAGTISVLATPVAVQMVPLDRYGMYEPLLRSEDMV